MGSYVPRWHCESQKNISESHKPHGGVGAHGCICICSSDTLPGLQEPGFLLLKAPSKQTARWPDSRPLLAQPLDSLQNLCLRRLPTLVLVVCCSHHTLCGTALAEQLRVVDNQLKAVGCRDVLWQGGGGEEGVVGRRDGLGVGVREGAGTPGVLCQGMYFATFHIV